MSSAADAGRGLDPEELARGHVSRSKQIVAAAARDLAHHERWLKAHLAAAERSRRRHRRWVKREQARERRQGSHLRLARSGTSAVLALARSSRAIGAALLDEAACAVRQWRHLTRRGAAWAAPKARAVSIRTVGGLSSAVASTGAKGRVLATIAGETASRGASWTIARGQHLGHDLGQRLALVLRRTIPLAAGIAATIRESASVSAATAGSAASWTWAGSRRLAAASRRSAAIGAVSMVAIARPLARDVLSGAFTAWSWMQANSRHVLLELRHAAAMVSPALRQAAGDAAVRWPALRSAARRTALRQSERLFLLAVGLRAQILAESDALSRAWRSASPVTHRPD